MKLYATLVKNGEETMGTPISVDENTGNWVEQARDAAWTLLQFYGHGTLTVNEMRPHANDKPFKLGARVLSITYEIHDE